jgi:hypothetical protein
MKHVAPLSLALLTLLPLSAPAQEPAPATPAFSNQRPYNIGFRVSEIVLSDLEGKDESLLAANPEKAVLLVFWSYRDPVSLHYARVLTELQARHAETLRVVLVDANHDELVINGDALARIREVVAAEKLTLPVRLDRGNRVADDFEAKNNSQVFLIDANRILRYKGGIDDDPRGERQKQGKPVEPMLANALASVLRGEKPAQPWTIASGRVIRRAPEPGAAR